MVVDALGDGEELGVALDDHPAGVDADSAGVREEVSRSSATPPPVAVELTLSTTRPESSSRAEAPTAVKRAIRSGPISGSSCAGAMEPTCTS